MTRAICSIIKNEHRYFREWAEHHLRQGFVLYVFEDYGSRSHQGLVSDPRLHIARLEDLNIPQIVNFRQQNLFTWFLEHYSDAADWVAFIDADEFLMLEDDTTWEDLTHDFRDATGICLFWRVIGASGHVHRPDLPLTEAYHNEAPWFALRLGWNYKSLVNMRLARSWDNIHKITGGVFTNHEPAPASMYPQRLIFERAWINHYMTKSWDDWVERMRGGAFTRNYRTADTFFEINPDMRPQMRELVESVRGYRFPSTNVLSRELGIYTGGNLNAISRFDGR